MARITLEKTLGTSFNEMHDPSLEASKKAFRDYNRRIKLLGQTGRLRSEDVAELINPRISNGESQKMEKAADEALSETDRRSRRLYMPGFSAVMIQECGYVLGVVEKPNDVPELNSYGPGLMWALLKVGQEKFASVVAKSSGSLGQGYRAVSDALTGKVLEDIPYADRHHIGGSSISRSLYPDSISMRKFETEKIHVGVSGVIGTPALRAYATMESSQSMAIVQEAERTGALAGFAGNLLAGSIDSTLGSVMLLAACDEQLSGRNPYTNLLFESVVSRRDAGINVH